MSVLSMLFAKNAIEGNGYTPTNNIMYVDNTSVVAPNLFEDITVKWAWGTGTDAGSSGNSGLLSGIAIITAFVPEPFTVALLGARVVPPNRRGS